ncbi:MAG TPA: NAD(P)-binding domain-containing protein [Thermoplasmata archaeon]|nr:NAD(P)-binding domain-containing protein [Thermoplasmata archaeon]
MYAILGCGAVGKEVAEQLVSRGKKVVIIDRSPVRVESLKELGFEAIVGGIAKVDPESPPLKDANPILILSSSDNSNLETLKRIKKSTPEKLVVVRAKSPNLVAELKKAKADEVIVTPKIIAQSLIRQIGEHELESNTEKLVVVIKQAKEGGVAIFMHDNPDPDSIASSLAFAEICKKFKVPHRIFYGGQISHQENRALVNLIGVEFEKVVNPTSSLEIVNQAGKVALIESSIPGINNSLPKDVVPDVVIDHHEARVVKGEFVDVRSDICAVATMMTQYLQQLSIVPDEKLATCLFYAIRVDASLLTRSISPTELQIMNYLSTLADPELLEAIESPPYSIETIDTLSKAITHREVRGSYLVTSVGFTNELNAISQAADFLLRLEGVSTVLVSGIVGENIHLSARSKDSRVNLGTLLQNAFGKEHAGGHSSAAGGKVPLGIFSKGGEKEDIQNFVENAVKFQFFAALNGEATLKSKA